MSIAEFGNAFFTCFLLPVSCVLFARSLVNLVNAGKDHNAQFGQWWSLALSVFLVVYAIAGAFLTKAKPIGSWLFFILAVVSAGLVIASILISLKDSCFKAQTKRGDQENSD